MIKKIVRNKKSPKKISEISQQKLQIKNPNDLQNKSAKNNAKKNTKENASKNLKKNSLTKKNLSNPAKITKNSKKNSSKINYLENPTKKLAIKKTLNKKLIKIKLSKQKIQTNKSKNNLITWSKINHQSNQIITEVDHHNKNQNLIKNSYLQNLFDKLKNQNQLFSNLQNCGDLNDCKFYHVKKRTNKYIAKRRLKNLYNFNHHNSLFKKIKSKSLKKINDKKDLP